MLPEFMLFTVLSSHSFLLPCDGQFTYNLLWGCRNTGVTFGTIPDVTPCSSWESSRGSYPVTIWWRGGRGLLVMTPLTIPMGDMVVCCLHTIPLLIEGGMVLIERWQRLTWDHVFDCCFIFFLCMWEGRERWKKKKKWNICREVDGWGLLSLLLRCWRRMRDANYVLLVSFSWAFSFLSPFVFITWALRLNLSWVEWIFFFNWMSLNLRWMNMWSCTLSFEIKFILSCVYLYVIYFYCLLPENYIFPSREQRLCRIIFTRWITIITLLEI